MPKGIHIHGVFLDIFDHGILLTGDPGIGKSDCALQLLDRKHQLIADDAPTFTIRDGQLWGSCPAELQNLLEVRGFGIIDVTKMYGRQAVLKEKNLSLIIKLTQTEDAFSRPIKPKLVDRIVFDLPIPELSLCISFTSNRAILVECAVRFCLPCVALSEAGLVKDNCYI